MTASTCAAGVACGAPAGMVAEAVDVGAAGLDDVGLDDAGLDVAGLVGVGRPAARFLRAAEGAGGTLATAAWKGRPAQDPATAEPHASGVCRAVTGPGAADRAAEPEPWVR